jgi:methylenetetrahydrofolate dehydrogenase (NADP+)/methenyltetrahydrofolate cyclohydrolase
MLNILDGKIIRDEILVRLKKEVEAFLIKPILSIIQVGDLAESNKYIKNKKSFAEEIGVEVKHLQFPDTISKTELAEEIKKLNNDKSVRGIIIQLPLPKTLEEIEMINLINPEKDVDGLTTGPKFVPATAKGVLTLLDYYKIEIAGKKVAMVGRSKLVGLPIAKVLQERGAEVSLVHSKTENPREITKQANILIVAIGKPNLIDETYVKEGQVIVDVGINFQLEKLVGDVNFEKVKNIVTAISPVPGGVGPLTVASLFENLVAACKK